MRWHLNKVLVSLVQFNLGVFMNAFSLPSSALRWVILFIPVKNWLVTIRSTDIFCIQPTQQSDLPVCTGSNMRTASAFRWKMVSEAEFCEIEGQFAIMIY